MAKQSLFYQERKKFHQLLLDNVLTIDANGNPSNADASQKSSVTYAKSIASQLSAQTGERLSAQTSGNKFEQIVASFLNETFKKLSHLRPGNWNIYQVGSRKGNMISEFAQYEHLQLLSELSRANSSLAASLGNDYSISPDIVVVRERETDEYINNGKNMVDASIALLTDMRALNGASKILHASVSTKWTLRSDRAQNARSEALNLLRNRKGRAPHIVVVTGEPTPSRLSSIALGTGDIDCVYHFALPELKIAIQETDNDEAENLLNIMIDGKRLKDIADLPLDLAI